MSEQTGGQPLATEPAPASRAGWAPCAHCDAPLDVDQRYCVVCGTRRTDGDDPVAGYFAAAARRARAAAAAAGPEPRATASLRTAAVLALLPLAIGVGVLVGRGEAGGDDRVLAALKAQKAPIVTIVGGGTGAVDAAAVASDYPRAGGFAIALRTLPLAATTTADVAAAKAALRAKGARNVAVAAPADFTVTPSAGDGYALVSGRFTTKAAAARALRRLRASFPHAKVVELRPAGGTAQASGGGEAKVLASGPAGEARQLEGSTPSQRQLDASAKAIDTINKAKGKAYVESQRNLPDSIVIP